MSNEKSYQEGNITEVAVACYYKASTSESQRAQTVWDTAAEIAVGTSITCAGTVGSALIGVAVSNPIGWAAAVVAGA